MHDYSTNMQYIEKFGPVLVDTLVRITKSPEKRKTAAYEGLKKILGRDTDDAQSKLASAETALDEANLARKKRLRAFRDEDSALEASRAPTEEELEAMEAEDALEQSNLESSPEPEETQPTKGKKKKEDDILSVFAPEKASKTRSKKPAKNKESAKKTETKTATRKKPTKPATNKK